MEKAKNAMEMVSAGAQFMSKALRLDPALCTEISKLRETVPMSWLLVERCECWRFKYKAIDVLLPQIKDAAYEVKSLLDEFTYQELKERVEGPHQIFPGVVSSSVTNTRNWWSDYRTKVKDVQERLDFVYAKLKETCDGLGIPENPNQYSKTTNPVTRSFINEYKLGGRDNELDEVIRLLGESSGSSNRSGSKKRGKKAKKFDLPESSDVKNMEYVSVLPIVGIGGIGKTTLAQMVCNNKMIKSHFELIIWVRVSDDFDVARLTKEIILGARKKVRHVNNLNFLQVTLRDALKTRRFLLVLDDMWSENKTDWDNLSGPIIDGCAGSMVIVTTRSQKVAEITGTISKGPIFLKGLEEGAYWEFFKSCAFGLWTNSEAYPELEKIGKQIVVKLKGSPLAAKTLGSLLRTSLDERHWRNIRDSEMWELQQEEYDILPVLQLSYQYLPFHLKKCFSFCSLYPKDYKFSECELTQFWISESLITLEENLQMEVVAKSYIHELVSRCFFQTSGNPLSGRYVIHDLMHDVAQSITKDECFRIENEDFEQKISTDVRHLSVFKCKLKVKKLKELCRYKKLHSLIIHENSVCGVKAIASWFNKLEDICSLSLPNCKINNLPESISNLKHLRYLNISSAKIARLPDSFCELYNLKYLNMKNCYHLESFPEDSNRLISLKLLELDEKKLPFVGHITNLANAVELCNPTFYISEVSGHRIGTLQHINKIYGRVRIRNLYNVSSRREAEQAQLQKKNLIHRLELCWMICIGQSDLQEEVLQVLCPHPNLKELVIDCYAGRIFPSWLETKTLINLTELEIWECNKLTSLENCLVPSNMPALKRIVISSCEELVLVPVENLIGFVSLEELSIKECPQLTCPREIALPPSIHRLCLHSCGDLINSISGSLHSCGDLTFLSIGGFPQLRRPRNMVLPPSLNYLELESCDGEVEEWLSVSLQNHTSLTNLRITNCPGIKSIPVHVTSHLKSLKFLNVQNCSELQSLGGDKFLASIQAFYIKGCPKLKETKGKDRDKKRRGDEEV